MSMLDTRALAENAVQEYCWKIASSELRNTYKAVLRGRCCNWEGVREDLDKLVPVLNRADLHCLVELAGTGLPCHSLPIFLEEWSREAESQGLDEEPANHQRVLDFLRKYFADELEEDEAGKEGGRLPLSLLAFAWPSQALGGLLRRALLHKWTISIKNDICTPELFDNGYLGCLNLSPEMQELHEARMRVREPHLRRAYPAIRAERARLCSFVSGQAVPPEPYTRHSIIVYFSSFLNLLNQQVMMSRVVSSSNVSGSISYSISGSRSSGSISSIGRLRKRLDSIVQITGSITSMTTMSKLDEETHHRNFSFLALLSGVATTKKEAMMLGKTLAEYQSCDAENITFLLTHYFTDDTAMADTPTADMPFTRLKYACPEGALAGLVQCLPSHLDAWMNPNYRGYNQDYENELPDLLKQDFVGQFYLEPTARALYTVYLAQIVEELGGEDEELERILVGAEKDRRRLISLFPDQALPSPPYSISHLLQYFRSYWLKVAVDRKRKRRWNKRTTTNNN